MSEKSERFVHYDRKYIAEVQDRKQDLSDHRGDKPNGLWFSVEGNGDGWREWCEAEQFALECITHSTEIVFRNDANLLRLRGADDLDAFSETYGYAPLRARSLSIDWKQVASQFDGIVIAPYVWERRLHEKTPWYYSWDCASGCVWNSRAVLKLIQLTPEGKRALAEAEGENNV